MKQRANNLLNLAQIGAFAGAVTVAAASPAHALSFDLTFDSSVASSFGSNTAQFETDIQDVANIYSALFTNPITLNITVAAVADTSVLGESNTSTYSPFTYTQVRNALISHASTPASTAATAALPVSEPASGTGHGFQVALAEAEALGLPGVNTSLSSGTITFGAGYTWAFDPLNQAVPGAYSLFGVAEHEMAEVMGRTTNLAGNTGTSPNMPIDLLRCTATGPGGAGVINMSRTATNVYFSADGCVTSEQTYNSVSGADLQDWGSATQAGSTPADTYDAYATPGASPILSTADINLMNTLGYEAALTAVPEPTSLALLLSGLGGLIFLRQRKSAPGSSPAV